MDKRTILALVLMAAVLVIGQAWMAWLSPPRKRAEPPQTSRTVEPPKPAEPPSAPTAARPLVGTPIPQSPPLARAPEPRPPQRLMTVDTPLYHAVISSEGGKLLELVLHYRGDKPLVVIGDVGPRGLLVGVGDGPPQPPPMQLPAGDVKVDAAGGDKAVTLTGSIGAVRVRETLTFHPNAFTFDTAVRLENVGAAPAKVTVALPWDTRQIWHETAPKFSGQQPTEVLWAIGNHPETPHPVCDVPAIDTPGRWIALDSITYMVAFIPRANDFRLTANAEDKSVCRASGKDPAGRATIAVQAAPMIAASQAWEGQVTVYAGPKEYERLKANGLEGAINFGGFPVPRQYGGLPLEWIGVPILLLMNWLYKYVGNYGIAIIVLTIVSKALFYPLTVKSMRSMRAMQALQPQVNALRSKYKSDPQRLNREMMELYRAHRVNPMGGCLPMLAQVPVFYALYVALTVSVELQNASFICWRWLSPLAAALRWMGMHWVHDLWICDLALPDPIYVLPLVMGVTMFVQQRMTPVSGPPQQAKMMMAMPLVFTFMFLNLASGLVLYWTVSNLLQIAQQKFMDRSNRPRAQREGRHAG